MIPVIRPAAALLMVAFGTPKFGWLNTLVNVLRVGFPSARVTLISAV